jgi:hypothetical protein
MGNGTCLVFSKVSVVPTGLVPIFGANPGLTPWAAFFRRFAAGLLHSQRFESPNGSCPLPTVRVFESLRQAKMLSFDCDANGLGRRSLTSASNAIFEAMSPFRWFSWMRHRQLPP